MQKTLTVKQILTKARALVKKGWTQGPFSTDKKGNAIETNSKKACTFCAVGAVYAVDGYDIEWGTGSNKVDGSVSGEAEAAMYLLSQAAGRDIINYNEARGRKKSDILKVYDKAIKLAGKK